MEEAREGHPEAAPPATDATSWPLLGAVTLLTLWATTVFAAPGRRSALVVAAVLGALLVALETRASPLTFWPAAEARPQRLRFAIGIALVVSTAAAVALPTLDAYFLGDDFGYVTLFHDRPARDLLRLGEISSGIWGRPLDEFRPLFALAFRLGDLLHGTNAVSWHLGNIALHALAAVLVFLLARSANAPIPTATLAGLLFAVAPAHAETVAWITGRVDLLPTLFYLASFVLFRRFRGRSSSPAYALSLALFAAGLLFKEILLTLPLMLVASDLLLDRERALGQPPALGPPTKRAFGRFVVVHLPFALVTLLYLSLRFLAVGNFAREERLSSTLGHGLAGTGLRLRFLLLPFEAVIRARPLDGLSTLGAGFVLGSLLALAILLLRGGAAWRRARAVFLFFGVLWPAVTFLPLLVTYPSPRHLYLPLAGTAVGLAVALLPMERAGLRVSRPRLAWAVVLLGFHAALLVRQEQKWAAAGRVSRELVEGLSSRLTELPPGQLVVLSGVPSVAADRRTQVWSYALPFALQPPHLATDLYSPHRFLESPDLYCCPPGVWWERKRASVLSLVAGPEADDEELTLLHWNARRRAVVVRRARLGRGTLRETIEAALGQPPEDALVMTRERADRLVLGLAASIRHAAAPPRGGGSAPREEDEGDEREDR